MPSSTCPAGEKTKPVQLRLANRQHAAGAPDEMKRRGPTGWREVVPCECIPGLVEESQISVRRGMVLDRDGKYFQIYVGGGDS